MCQSKKKPFQVLPSAIAPKAKIPDSLTSHSLDESVSFKIGISIGRISSLNTLANTSKAAALHFPKL